MKEKEKFSISELMNMRCDHVAVKKITLLFLCKTATKKTLHIEEGIDCWIVWLECLTDDDIYQTFYTSCIDEAEAKELEKNCVEWLNY